MLEQLVASARSNSRGIITADRHFRSIETCFDGDFCPIKLFGAASQEKWIESLKEAESRLTYSTPELEIKDITSTQVTKGACMDFDCVLTATGVDRDGDILESKGAIVDPRMPLLWQHIALQPVGKLVSVISQTDKSIIVRNAIIDNEFGRDVAQLVEFGALRISHGFAPKTFAPLKDGGWHIKEFDVLEVSVVSVPANPSAVITAFSRGKLHHPLVKGWAKKHFDERPTTVAMPRVEPDDAVMASMWKSLFEKVYGDATKATCGCGKSAEAPAPVPEAKSDDMDEDDKREGTCRKCGHKGPMSEFMKPDGECSFDAVKTISAMLVEASSGTRSQVKQVVDRLCALDERMELDALLEV